MGYFYLLMQTDQQKNIALAKLRHELAQVKAERDLLAKEKAELLAAFKIARETIEALLAELQGESTC